MLYWVKLIQEISTILVGFIFYNEVWYFIYIFIHNSGYINKQKVSTEWNVCLLSKRQFNTEILNNPTIINITNKYICTSHPHSLNIKKTKTYADEYPWRWLGQVQTCGGENIFKPLFPLQPFNMCCPMWLYKNIKSSRSHLYIETSSKILLCYLHLLTHWGVWMVQKLNSVTFDTKP